MAALDTLKIANRDTELIRELFLRHFRLTPRCGDSPGDAHEKRLPVGARSHRAT